MNANPSPQYPYPLPISRTLSRADNACASGEAVDCHAAVPKLADAITYYLGAVAVGQYSQALFLGDAEVDPTLNRSLRNLRRLLPGQWLGWITRSLVATPNGPVEGFADWYSAEQSGAPSEAYKTVQKTLSENLAYTGEYGPRERVSPRLLLELIDQYRIRRSKTPADALPSGIDETISNALLSGLHTLLASAHFLTQYPLYAPNQRQLLMGLKPTMPMPPISAPADSAASLLLYPPGEVPDYTKRPNLQAERQPLFPLDPLLIYMHCVQCNQYRVAALQGVDAGTPAYLGLDPDCGHRL